MLVVGYWICFVDDLCTAVTIAALEYTVTVLLIVVSSPDF